MFPFNSESASDRRESERRSADRFAIERELKFSVLGRRGGDQTGGGTTVNMSSKGILFDTNEQLLPGRKLELQIHWPAQLDSGCPLKLVARGVVVRVDHSRVAMDIQQYEFRTMKRAAAAAAAGGHA